MIELVMRLEREGDVRLPPREPRGAAPRRPPLRRRPGRGPEGRRSSTPGSRTAACPPICEGLRPEHAAWLSQPAGGRPRGDVAHPARRLRPVPRARSARSRRSTPRSPGSSSARIRRRYGVLLDRARGPASCSADPARLDALLAALGAERVIHGHTPIAIVRGCDPRIVTEPLVLRGRAGAQRRSLPVRRWAGIRHAARGSS